MRECTHRPLSVFLQVIEVGGVIPVANATRMLDAIQEAPQLDKKTRRTQAALVSPATFPLRDH